LVVKWVYQLRARAFRFGQTTESWGCLFTCW